MPLASGTRLGPYEVLSLIGAGGMGEVYKAQDTRLGRTVAIKILPADISHDANRRARFEREARTIAALSHPHICTVYDVGEHSGSMFLVMERLDGETLAARLRNGPVPIAEALRIATDVADGLAAAHRQGVVHRDLKPSNIMITRSGAKLLDFGLAKPTDGGGRAATGLMTSSVSTQSTPITAEGVIAGTLQYMAPEQLEGKPADARSDLWAVGAILYEMVTGKRPFEGSSAVGVISAILERDPLPLPAVQPLTPTALDRVVRQCLAKTPDERPDTAHDLANALRWIRESGSSGSLPAVRAGRLQGRSVRLGILAALAIVLTAAVTLWLWLRSHPFAPPMVRVVRSELGIAPAEELNAGTATGWAWMPAGGGSHTAFTWTPDGQTLVFAGRRGGVQQLYARGLDRDEARPLAGTEGAKALAVSADGQWVAFWADNALKKVSIAGGPVVDVASAIDRPPMGLAWDSLGNLYFGRVEDRRIWRVSGDRAGAITSESETNWADILPSPLPGGEVLLYTVRKRDWSWGDEEIVAQNMATGARKVLLRDAADARYVDTGHLIFLRRGVLFAVAFDPKQVEVRGTPVALLDNVVQALTGIDSSDVTGAGQFAIAATGALAWVRGPVVPYRDEVLASVDRGGRVSPLAVPRRPYVMGVRSARGGTQVAVAVRDLSEVSLWIYDLARGAAAPLPMPRGGEAYLQAWTADGQQIVFHWLKDERSSLAIQRVDGTSPPEVLGIAGNVAPSSTTPDGRQIVAVTYDKDLAVVTIQNGKAALRPLTHTPYTEQWPELSPDGRWLAYASDESGRDEVYVQPYPGPGPRTQVSLEGGESPAWNANGHELFFISLPDAAGKRRMEVARFNAGSPVRIGTAQALFDFAPRDLKFLCGTIRCYDIAPDGQRFYVVQTPAASPAPVVTRINLVQNWFEELKAKVR